MEKKRELGLIEIVLHVRNGVGEPTGKKVSFTSSNGAAISDFYEKNKFVKPNNNKKNRKNKKK